MELKKLTVDVDAIIGLAIATAMFRGGYSDNTEPSELDDDDSWEEVASTAIDYCQWAGLKQVSISRDDILLSVWNIESAD